MLFQEHVTEKLKLVQDFLHVEAQDQLSSLEEEMKSSEITMVGNCFRYLNHYQSQNHSHSLFHL